MAPTFQIRCRASDYLRLAIVNGEPVLADAHPRDERQLWFKDMRYAAGLKDEAGLPAFALVNKATGEALKHSFGYRCPVRAIKFEPGYADESLLWAESEDDLGDGFFRIHMINNMDYIFDAERGTPQYGGARDGTRLILFRWHGGMNQQWRIAPHSVAPAAPLPELAPPEHARPVRILCQSGEGLSLTVRDGAAVLASADSEDDAQCWVQSYRNAGHVTDGEGHRAFALVNRATGKALRRGRGEDPVHLAGHNPDWVDVALLWTESDDLGEGFHSLRTVSDVSLVLDAANGVPEAGGARDGTPIIVFPWNGGANQKWKMVPFYG